MGSFTQAMDASQPARTLGENGAPELTAHGVGDARVALFAGLTRNCASLDALCGPAAAEEGPVVRLGVLAQRREDAVGRRARRRAVEREARRVRELHREAQVAELDLDGVAAEVHEHVLGLDVAVRVARLVHARERGGDAREDLEPRPRPQEPAGAHVAVELLAEEVRDDVEEARRRHGGDERRRRAAGGQSAERRALRADGPYLP